MQKNKKNILFLMLNFPYDESREHMYKDLAYSFAKDKHNVYVVAALEKKYNKKTHIEVRKNINILWVNTGNFFNTNKFRKGLTLITIPVLFKMAIKRYFNQINIDLLIYPTPAVTLVSLVEWLIYSNKEKVKRLLIVKDIFPQNAIDIGVIKNKVLISFFRNKEVRLYKTANYLGCMSQGNINFLKKHNDFESGQKLFILENWMNSDFKIIPKTETSLSEVCFYQDDFVCVYGGNISYANALDFLLDLAILTKNKGLGKIRFVIVGQGVDKKRLFNRVVTDNISNIVTMDSLSTEKYNYLLSRANLGLVNLSDKYTIPNIPSKTLNLMKIGKPILAATDKNTDYNIFLEEIACCGLWCETGDLDSYFKNLILLYNDESLRDRLAENGKRYFEEHLTVDAAYKQISKEVLNDF